MINKKGIRFIATLMVVVMVMSVFAVLPFSASAYSSSDSLVKEGTVTGSKLPEGAEVYDGTPATGFAGGTGTQEDPYQISNAKEFVYFRDVHLPSLLDTRVVVSSFTGGSSSITYTKTVTDAEGNSTTEEKTVSTWSTTKINTTCAVESQNRQLYYKLTGDIYLNSETYGSSNKGYHLNGISKSLATTDYIEISANENGEMHITDTTPTGDGTHTTVIHNADGTTTTYSCSANSQISITSTIKFDGVLDGDGYTIYNVYEYVGSHENSEHGIFNTLNGTVKNLNIAGLRFGSGYGDQERHKFGGIATYLYGTVQNVRVTNAHLFSNSAIGCIASEAKAGAQLIDCSSDGFVEGRYSAGYGGGTVAGGLVGRANQAGNAVLVQNCTNYATISARGRVSQGGIIGQISGSTVNLYDCVNYGDIVTYSTDEVSTRSAGGVVGSISGAATATTLTRCTNYASVTSVREAGGIVGNVNRNNGTKVNILLTDCTNYGKIEGNAGVGGIVGLVNAAGTPQLTLTNCVNLADLKGVQYVGGLVGRSTYGNDWNDGTIAFYNCSTSGNIEATTSHAGFAVGGTMTVYNGTAIDMKNFVATGTVKAPTYVAGITGSQTIHRGNTSSIKLENVWIFGQLIATAEDARVAAIAADSNTTPGNLNNVYQAVHNIPVTAKNCGFAITDKNGDAVTVGTWCTTNAEGTDATGSSADTVAANMVQYVATTYNNGTETVEGAYPTFDAADLTSGVTLASLNKSASIDSCTLWAQGEAAPVLVTTLGISGATMSLSSNMALNMKLDASTLAGLTVTNVAFVDAEGNGINAVKDDLGRYSASYVKRAADMAKEMKLHLVITIAGNEYVSTNILTYSPLTYLTNLYADYTGEKQSEANATKVLNVVTAMLGYGAAAETKDSGATTIAAKMTALEITAPTFTEGYTDHISGVVTEDDKTAINNIAQVGATLTGGMELTFTMKNTAYTALSIADFGTFTADENGKITVTGINAAMIKDALRLTFTGDGVDGVSANFTVGDFLESRRDNADETALAEATILYMMAARAYVLN